MSEVVVKVKKDGKDAFTQSGASKLRFKLDYNKKYTLIFTKPGYITKTIEINTAAPSKRIADGFDPYKIGVKLFLQNAENMVIYNQPVANIKYDQNLDEFNFDTDYSKSILSAITRDEEPVKEAAPVVAEQPLEKVAESQTGSDVSQSSTAPEAGTDKQDIQKSAPTIAQEEKKTDQAKAIENTEIKPDATVVASTSPQEESIAPPPANAGEEAKQPSTAAAGESIKTTGTATDGQDASPKASTNGGNDQNRTSQTGSCEDSSKRKIKTTSGEDVLTARLAANGNNEAPTGEIIANESEKITREDIVEKNRIITKIKVIKNGVQTDYSRVNYSWGGLYYFKNSTTSIPENLFVQWTGVRN